MSMVGVNSAEALPDPLSVIVQTMSVGAKAISLSAWARPIAGSFSTEVVTGIFRTVPATASGVTTIEADFTRLGSSVEV